MSPTARTLKSLRDDGWTVEVVERWNPHTMTRHDLYGFADLLAFRGDDVLAVQATSTGNMTSRVKKIVELDTAREWLGSQRRLISVVGWKRYKQAIDRKYWRPTWRPITLEDMQ